MNTAHQAINRLEAGRVLRLMDTLEASAQQYEAAKTEMLRNAIAKRYRQLFGIEPSQRHEFRAALERVREQGGIPVKELVDYFRDQSKSLLGSSTTSR